MIKFDILKDILVLVFVYMPPLLIFIRFWRERNRSKVLLTIISLFYIVLSLFTQNLIPFVFVLINIKYLKSADDIGNIFRSMPMLGLGIDYNKRNISSRVRGDYSKFKFSIRKFNIILALKLTFLSYLMTILISIVESTFVTKFRIEAKQQEIVTYMTNMSLNKFIIMIPIIIIFAPILEEFVFRWLFFQKIFRPRLGVYFSAFLSSVMFAFIHFNARAFPLLLWIGLYNCYLIHKKGYWYSVFNHFAFNAVTTMALLFEKLGTLKL